MTSALETAYAARLSSGDLRPDPAQAAGLARLARQAAAGAPTLPGAPPSPVVLRAGAVPAEPTTVDYPLSSSPL